MHAIFDEDQPKDTNLEARRSDEKIVSKRRRIELDDTDDEYVPPSLDHTPPEESENEIERRNTSSSHPSMPSLQPIPSESQHEVFEDAVSRAVSNEENVVQQHEDVENRDESRIKNDAKPQNQDETQKFDDELGETDDSDVEELPDSPLPEDSNIVPAQPNKSPNPSPIPSPENDDDDYVNQVLADQEIGEYDDDELYADHQDEEDDPEDMEQLLDDYEGREGVDYGQEPAGY